MFTIMSNKAYFNVLIRLIALFIPGFMVSFLIPEIREVLGDTKHICNSMYCSHGAIDEGYDWGAQHYWFFCMCASIFILSLINFIIYLVDYMEDTY